MPKGPGRIQFVADRGDARLRLDQVLVRRVTEVTRMSRSRAQQWIESGAVLVNGTRASRPASHLVDGAIVEIELPASTEARQRAEPEDLPLDVLYEDDHLVAINKPAGVVVHPSYKNTSGTTLNAVLHRVRARSGVRPGIVTRLDKETSGLLLVALTAGVHAQLQREPPRKEYLAIVKGVPAKERGTIDLPLARDPNDRRRMVVARDGMPSETRYELISTIDDLSVVRCELVTGRTHQIRVHLAARGLPIVGDAMYGVPHEKIARVALHSWRLRLDHPVSGESIELSAPPPDDMAVFGLPTTLRL